MYTNIINIDFSWTQDVLLLYYVIAFGILAGILICFPSILSWIGKAIVCLVKAIAWTIGGIIETTMEAVGYLTFLVCLLGAAYGL